MERALAMASPSCFTLTMPKPRLFTVSCRSISAPAADNGLAEVPWKVADARLVLEDGSVWRAKSFGASGTQVGEVVFNTSLTGYQEILTDPSYAGQFVLMTNPHIGNTGVNYDDEESRQCFLAGLVIRSLSISTSNWRCTETLGDYLASRNIMGIYDVDTRAITRRLRQDGSLIGVLSTEKSKTDEELLNMSRTWDIVGVDLISGVSCEAPYEWVDRTDSEWDFNFDRANKETFRVVAYDFGIKSNILRRLASYGCKITVVPSTWPVSETLKLKPDGVLFSNGPGDPSAVPCAVETVKEIVGKVPSFGICMGHQLLGQALGGKTFKMKFGHHGGNHPVRNIRNGRVEISAQALLQALGDRKGINRFGDFSAPLDEALVHVSLDESRRSSCLILLDFKRLKMAAARICPLPIKHKRLQFRCNAMVSTEETRRLFVVRGAAAFASAFALLNLRCGPAPARAEEKANQEAKDEGLVGALQSLLDPNEKSKSGKVLPKAYLKSAREVVKTLRESLGEDTKDIVKFRRTADAAKESIREYLNGWRGQKAVVNEESYVMLEKAIRSLADFYSKAGPSAPLPEEVKSEILSDLTTAEESL